MYNERTVEGEFSTASQIITFILYTLINHPLCDNSRTDFWLSFIVGMISRFIS